MRALPLEPRRVADGRPSAAAAPRWNFRRAPLAGRGAAGAAAAAPTATASTKAPPRPPPDDATTAAEVSRHVRRRIRRAAIRHNYFERAPRRRLAARRSRCTGHASASFPAAMHTEMRAKPWCDGVGVLSCCPATQCGSAPHTRAPVPEPSQRRVSESIRSCIVASMAGSLCRLCRGALSSQWARRWRGPVPGALRLRGIMMSHSSFYNVRRDMGSAFRKRDGGAA